tara:strand:- start:515 stop:694 length:180 start_codon:yes stop_codon:yes gene_type:complete
MSLEAYMRIIDELQNALAREIERNRQLAERLKRAELGSPVWPADPREKEIDDIFEGRKE